MRDIATKLTLVVSLAAAGCGPEAVTSETAPAAIESPVHDIMRQKLACGQSILEGLAEADFPRIEANARLARGGRHGIRRYHGRSALFIDVATPREL